MMMGMLIVWCTLTNITYPYYYKSAGPTNNNGAVRSGEDASLDPPIDIVQSSSSSSSIRRHEKKKKATKPNDESLFTHRNNNYNYHGRTKDDDYDNEILVVPIKVVGNSKTEKIDKKKKKNTKLDHGESTVEKEAMRKEEYVLSSQRIAMMRNTPPYLLFRPNPTIRARRMSTSSSLSSTDMTIITTMPKSTTPIKLNRWVVCLDEYYIDIIQSKQAHTISSSSIEKNFSLLQKQLQQQLQQQQQTESHDDTNDLAQRAQTVVWDDATNDCVPMSTWQMYIHPTCNTLHEMDITQLLTANGLALVSSKGFWRNAWKVDVVVVDVVGRQRAFSGDDSATISSHHTSKKKKSSSVRLKQQQQQQQQQQQDTYDYDDDEYVATNQDIKQHVVLKSIKYIHEPNEEIFELSRVDAISLDVLTKSKYIINIYGYCGSSSVQEYAGGDLKGLLPVLDPIDKLRMATWVATGVADIHAVDSSLWNNSSNTTTATTTSYGYVVDNDNKQLLKDTSDDDATTTTDIIDSNDGNKATATTTMSMSTTSSSVASLIHNDINMDNILLGYRNGIQTPLINDFNIAVFRKWNVRTNVPCLFHGRFANPQWMSPEQMEREGDELSIGKLDEKIDIYALGNILYKIAVGNSPWKFNYKVSKITSDEKPRIARAKLRGQKPKVPPDVILAASSSNSNSNSNSTASLSSSSSSSIKAILSAMNKCYRNNATLRPSAEYIATYLQSELDTIELRMKVMDSFEF
jgi:hypothetical protein